MMEPDAGSEVKHGDDHGRALVSIAISMKRIADAIETDIERHNSDVPGPLTRIADQISGGDQRLGLVDGIMHAIEQGFIAGRNG